MLFCSHIPLKEKLNTSKLIPSFPKLIRNFFNRLVRYLDTEKLSKFRTSVRSCTFWLRS